MAPGGAAVSAGLADKGDAAARTDIGAASSRLVGARPEGPGICEPIQGRSVMIEHSPHIATGYAHLPVGRRRPLAGCGG